MFSNYPCISQSLLTRIIRSVFSNYPCISQSLLTRIIGSLLYNIYSMASKDVPHMKQYELQLLNKVHLGFIQYLYHRINKKLNVDVWLLQLHCFLSYEFDAVIICIIFTKLKNEYNSNNTLLKLLTLSRYAHQRK